jgi:hypothetical protein
MSSNRRFLGLKVRIDQCPYRAKTLHSVFRKMIEVACRREVNLSEVEKIDPRLLVQEHDLASREEPHEHVLEEGCLSWEADASGELPDRGGDLAIKTHRCQAVQ